MKYEPTLHKLSNGAAVILDPMDAATTYVIVNFKTGSRDESPSEHGLTHFCEHMLCAGTRRFKTSMDINDYVEDNGGIRGAYTSDKYIRLYGNIVAENSGVLLDVFSDQLQNSVLDKDVLERERMVVADELRRALDDQSRNDSEFVFKNIMHGDYSSYRTLGTFENIASFTGEQMKLFMVRRMTAANCLICVSGKIDNPEKLLSLIERKFSWLPSTEVSYNMSVPVYTPTTKHLTKSGKKNTHLAVLVPQLYKLNSENRFNRMCVTSFNNYLNKELFRVLRMENGLAYGVNLEYFIVDDLGINGFSAQTAPENIGRMVALMAKTAREACFTNPITDDFLTRDNNSCRLGDAMWLESPMRRCIRLVANYMDYNGELYDFYGTLKTAAQIKAKDVIARTQGYFNQPVSIISRGAKFDADVTQIWYKNFGAMPCGMLKIKENSCR